MKNSIVFVAAAFLCLVAFPTSTVGKYWPQPQGWPNPSQVSRNEQMFLNTGHRYSYGDSKVWKCTYSNGSAPAISISPSTPFPTTPSTPSPSTPSPKTPSTPSPSPPTPKTSPPPPTPKTSPPPTPKKSPPPTPKTSPPPAPKTSPPPAPKKSPPPAPKKSPPPTPKKSPPPTPKKAPSPPSTPSLPPPTPKSPSVPSTPSNPPAHHHNHQNPWEHIESCLRNMGPVGMCRMQMEISFATRLFQVSDYCCNLVANMRSECDDVAWGFFTDPFFVPLVRYTCHVSC